MRVKKGFLNVFEFICRIHGHPSCVVRIISHKFFGWHFSLLFFPHFYGDIRHQFIFPTKISFAFGHERHRRTRVYETAKKLKPNTTEKKMSFDKHSNGKLQKRTPQQQLMTNYIAAYRAQFAIHSTWAFGMSLFRSICVFFLLLLLEINKSDNFRPLFSSRELGHLKPKSKLDVIFGRLGSASSSNYRSFVWWHGTT